MDTDNHNWLAGWREGRGEREGGVGEEGEEEERVL